MPDFRFIVPLNGEATYYVNAATEEEAAALLKQEYVQEGINNRFLMESDTDFNLSDWCNTPVEEKLLEFVDEH